MNKKAEKILNTTIILFLNNGIKKITMDEIAETAKASKVTVYKYFSDKDTLYYEVGKYLLANHIAKLKNITETKNSLIEQFYSFIDVLTTFTNMGYFKLCKELTTYNIKLLEEYNNYLNFYKEILLKLIDMGIEQKLLKPNLDRLLIFYYLDMGISYYQENSDYRKNMNENKNIQNELMRFHVSNIFLNADKILNKN
ncbi:MAG: TetR/AcrR family transcriptional regulator [Pleomorphochaeta sp.]